MYTSIYMYTYTCMYTSIYVRACMYLCIHEKTCVRRDEKTCVWTEYIDMYICVHMCA